MFCCCSQPPAVSPEHCPWEDQAAADSTTTLLHTRGSLRLEGTLSPWQNATMPCSCSSEEIFTASWTVATFTILMTWSFSLTDVTYNFDQIVNGNSPESCWSYLMNLEKRGNPHTDINLLNKLKDCYSKIFSRLPIRQYSKNASYAKILVRYAELKGWVWRKILPLCMLGGIVDRNKNF